MSAGKGLTVVNVTSMEYVSCTNSAEHHTPQAAVDTDLLNSGHCRFADQRPAYAGSSIRFARVRPSAGAGASVATRYGRKPPLQIPADYHHTLA
jgi:hypothetical protein